MLFTELAEYVKSGYNFIISLPELLPGRLDMLHNEHEAREIWCHMTLGTSRSKCLGSNCMAWRWSEYTPRGYEKFDTEGAELTDKPEERRGFCGLAGLPKF